MTGPTPTICTLNAFFASFRSITKHMTPSNSSSGLDTESTRGRRYACGLRLRFEIHLRPPPRLFIGRTADLGMGMLLLCMSDLMVILHLLDVTPTRVATYVSRIIRLSSGPRSKLIQESRLSSDAASSLVTVVAYILNAEVAVETELDNRSTG